MDLLFYNYKDQKINKKELIYCIKFYLSLLFKPQQKHIVDELSISVKFQEMNEDGLCEFLDDDEDPRMFLIHIQKGISRKRILKALAHEMVHLKQFALNELLKFDVDDAPVYKGKTYRIDEMSYWDWPWEIEANGREVGMYTRYVAKLQDNHKLRQHLLS